MCYICEKRGREQTKAVIEWLSIGHTFRDVREMFFEKFGERISVADLSNLKEAHKQEIEEEQTRLYESAFDAFSAENLLIRLHRLVSFMDKNPSNIKRVDFYAAVLRFGHELRERIMEQKMKEMSDEEALRRVLNEMIEKEERIRSALEAGLLKNVLGG